VIGVSCALIGAGNGLEVEIRPDPKYKQVLLL